MAMPTAPNPMERIPDVILTFATPVLVALPPAVLEGLIEDVLVVPVEVGLAPLAVGREA